MSMSYGTMYHRWDLGWKILCSPKHSWGVPMIEALTGRDLEGYRIAEELNTEQDVPDGPNIFADKIIKIAVDDMESVIHLEFQSTAVKGMGLRLLKYGVSSNPVNLGVDSVHEVYCLPDTYLVNVRNYPGRPKEELQVSLRLHNQEASLRYPVVDAYTAVPEVKGLAMARDSREVYNNYIQLSRKLGGWGRDASEIEKFMRACISISNPGAFAREGVKASSVEGAMKVMTKVVPFYPDERYAEGKAEGLAEGGERERARSAKERTAMIKNLMKNLACSEEQARKLLGLGVDDMKKPGGVSTMDL